MAVADPGVTSTRVRRQYEFLPYPHREAEEEKRRLLLTGLDDLNAVNHYCYRGRRNLKAGFRVLVAGGGTGDAVVFLAHQLRKSLGEIVYVDLSEASQAVAKRRLRARGLEHRVHWIHGSLLDLPAMGLGKFDYINCSGVLHHLADPDAGLAALRQVLQDDGALGLMVYGQYGRAGVYQLQSLFRLIGDSSLSLGEQVDNARRLLKTLPPCNWYRRGAEMFASVDTMNDSELLDMFLHTQDRAYTVPEIYGYLDKAGMHFAEWSAEGRVWYQPQIAFHDAEWRRRIMSLPPREQQAACEIFWGSIIKHALWATPNPNTVAQWSDPDMTPTWARVAGVFGVREGLIKAPDGTWALDLPKPGGAKIQVRMKVDEVTRRFIALADGYRSITGILDELTQQLPQLTREQLNGVCVDIFQLLNTHDILLLRHSSVPFIPD